MLRCTVSAASLAVVVVHGRRQIHLLLWLVVLLWRLALPTGCVRWLHLLLLHMLVVLLALAHLRMVVVVRVAIFANRLLEVMMMLALEMLVVVLLVVAVVVPVVLVFVVPAMVSPMVLVLVRVARLPLLVLVVFGPAVLLIASVFVVLCLVRLLPSIAAILVVSNAWVAATIAVLLELVVVWNRLLDVAPAGAASMVRVALSTTAATLVLIVGVVRPRMLLLVPIATGTALAPHRRHIAAASVAVVEVLRVRGGR